MFGLLRQGNEGLIPYALRLYKSRKKEKFELSARIQAHFLAAMRAAFPGIVG